MRLSDLRDRPVLGPDGERLGRVHDVHCEKGKVTALMCGVGGFIERWTGKKEGRRIAWEMVKRIDEKGIVVSPGSPQKTPPGKASASRSRQGTRRPSGRRSKR